MPDRPDGNNLRVLVVHMLFCIADFAESFNLNLKKLHVS